MSGHGYERDLYLESIGESDLRDTRSDDQPCPDCDDDGYIDILDDYGGVLGPAPCPRGCHVPYPAPSPPGTGGQT